MCVNVFYKQLCMCVCELYFELLSFVMEAQSQFVWGLCYLHRVAFIWGTIHVALRYKLVRGMCSTCVH